MRVMLTGASGFIGQRLVASLLRERHSVHALGRRRPGGPVELQFSDWNVGDAGEPSATLLEAVTQSDAIIHLAGEPVAQRWNPEVKSRIRDSRILGTRAIVNALSRAGQRPQTLICASAIGYYGSRGDEILVEESPAGQGFLPDVCIEWEREARAAGNLGLRIVTVRIGIVLGREGGALKQMLTPFRLGMGGPISSGEQWMSWIHADDLVNVILFALRNADLFGPVNATAPNPVRNAEFAAKLGEVLGRPAVVRTPVFALRMILGEAAEVVLASQRVLPQVLIDTGFEFQHAEIRGALQAAI